MSHDGGPGGIEHRVADVFRAPEFGDARSRRVLSAARAGAGRVRASRGRSRGARYVVALAACAAVLVAVAVWPSVRGASGPARPATVPRPRTAATRLRFAADLPTYAAAGHGHPSSATEGTRYSIDQLRRQESTAGQGVWLSTEIVSEPVAAGDRLDVRLTVTNFWGPTARWDDFRFGLSVTTTFQPDPAMPDGIGIGGMEAKRAVPGSQRPLTLGAGESTTTIISTAVPAGIWQVVGSYVGGGPSGATPPIEIHVGKRTP